jgi:hypothetical protein
MASFTMDQKMFVNKTFYSSDCSYVVIESQHCWEFSIHVAPLWDTTGLLNRLKKQDTCSKCMKGHKWSMHIHTDEAITEAWKVITWSPRKSVWYLHSRLGPQPALHEKSANITFHCFYTKFHRRWNSERLCFCRGALSATRRQSGCCECCIALWWSTLPLG